ncbi:MAG: FkbM family methyltransferase [Chloroflexi bacterium]|nr:FkbM family methyltransferase [Chloroflexota bacterium]
MYQILALVGRYWPFHRGTGWLVERPSGLVHRWPQDKRFRLKDGRIFQGDLNDPLFRSLYLYGTYEPVVSNALYRMVRAGDTVVDVGANIGVITTLLGRLVGSSGQVFSFEPVPQLFEILTHTISLNGLNDNVQAVNVAVGNTSTNVVIFVPQKQSHACSSIKVDDFSSAIPHRCTMVSLEHTDFISKIPSLVKVDVEGAEMSVLCGAASWCSAQRPPIWVMEINHKAAKRFGYAPEDLVTWLIQYGYRHFFCSDVQRFQVFDPRSKFPSDGTVCCAPQWAIDDGRILYIQRVIP